MIGAILAWLTKGPLDRIFKTIDNSMDNETERQKAKDQLVAKWAETQASQFNSKAWMVFAALLVAFALPLLYWWAAVIIYSVHWCRGCASPVTWTIAALPPPLDQWAGGIMATLFSGMSGIVIMERWRKK